MPVFISYSRIDETVVKTLAQGLEAAKRDVWSDHNLAGGDVWWDAILANIRSSEVFLFALSDASLNSKPCRLELDYALALERPVLPVQVGAVTSLRANPLAELQIIGYRADDAHSGFAVLSAVEEATQRVRPLPEPLPPPPPIPFKYLLALGQQIDSTELSVEEQKAVVDQLRRALDEETDESVRRDILGMLRNLDSKPFTTKRTQKGIAALLLVHGPDGEAGTADTSTPAEVAAGPAVPAAGGSTSRPADPSATAPTAGGTGVTGPVTPEPDPRDWFAERLELLQQQRQAAAQRLDPDPAPWRPATDAAAQWRGSFGGTESADAGRPQERPSYFAAPPQSPPSGNAVAGPGALQPQGQGWAPGPVPPPPSQQPAPSPPNYWAMSVIAFVLSLLFGGVAMYFSYQVGQRYRTADLEGARRASAKAKSWGIVGIVVGSLFWIVVGL